MPEETLTNTETEQVDQPQASDEQTETAQDSSTEQKTETVVTPSSEGENTQSEENLPFHKHPRWQRMNEEKKALEATVNDLLAFKQQVESKSSDSSQQSSVPEWFKNLYGDNPQVWSQYQSYEKDMRQQIKTEALNELKGEQEKQTQEVQKWNKWVDTQFDDLEDTGKTFDRNEFRKFILDYNAEYKSLPLNEKGDIDIPKCYELMTRLNPPSAPDNKLIEKKKLASKMASGTTTESKQSDFISLEELRGKRNWRDF